MFNTQIIYIVNRFSPREYTKLRIKGGGQRARLVKMEATSGARVIGRADRDERETR